MMVGPIVKARELLALQSIPAPEVVYFSQYLCCA